MTDFSFLTITTLALGDSVNPCEMAILTMILISILIHNPEKRRKVLYAGLAFTSALFLGYLIYGLIIIQLFHSFSGFIGNYSIYVFRGLAILTMILGALNIKDFFMYQPGGLATEMPLWMRPYAKELTKKITSVSGAFVIGVLLTIFLIPCTGGPLVVASGLLSKLSFFNAIPWLLWYNFIFVLPMIAITLLIFFAFTTVENVSSWKERNIKYLHLIAGILLFIVGTMLLMGWL